MATGIVFDTKISARMKGQMFKLLVRPAMLHGLETVSQTKNRKQSWR